jgi:hypothetical protein
VKYLRILIFVPFLFAFQCDDEIDITEDGLYESGLFGTWEITNETINGISDMLPKCCNFIEFYPDSNEKDLVGSYTYTDEFDDYYNGIFTVDLSSQIIIFDQYDNSQRIYEFTLDSAGEYLTFTFTENESELLQTWKKIY